MYGKKQSVHETILEMGVYVYYCQVYDTCMHSLS